MYKAQWLSVEYAESDFTAGMYKAQWLSVEDAEPDSTAGMCKAQWLSVEDAESDSTAGMYVQRSLPLLLLTAVLDLAGLGPALQHSW